MALRADTITASRINHARRLPVQRVNASIPRLIFRSDCNDSPPQLRFCRLDRAHQAQRLIQSSKHKSKRTISARRGGVNWKMDKLTRGQAVAWRGPRSAADSSAAGDAHMAAHARAVVP